MNNSVSSDQIVAVTNEIYDIKQFREEMRVRARLFLNKKLLDDALNDRSLWQLTNVATLPGIQGFAFGMPDIHEGYGFPIGGVAAFAIDEGGIISPGGIGYDINCGVRLLISNMSAHDIKSYLPAIAREIFKKIPSGVGRSGAIDLSIPELDTILKEGAKRMVSLGYGEERDLALCEENGCMDQADPLLVSDEAKKRGSDQLGTLGSGNHFLEIQQVDKIFDEKVAQSFGIFPGQVTVMIHCGSRGLGHQICTDYVRMMMQKQEEIGITVPDRELICAPFHHPLAQQYFHAMQAAANFAWANRHVIAHNVRHIWKKTFGSSVDLLYDVSHNIGKKEIHTIDGQKKEMIMHRKGATRAFGPGRNEVPALYRHTGQPVLVPGTMGTASYVMSGIKETVDNGFGSCCHGAGRTMSRVQAKKMVHGLTLRKELEQKGIVICTDSNSGLAEEAPLAYKNVDEVVSVVEKAGLARMVARLTPLAVVKGG